ncbi:MAG: cell division protein SepF [Cryobacterium sp.]|jgi:cell division inhibitor SepF|nr:cell division protein SepF [Cryobacterium sp.]
MANPLRKTMVYLGLADEEFDDYGPAPAAPQAVANASAAPAHGGHHQVAQRAPVTPLRRPARTAAPIAEMNEILTVHPRQYKDAQTIAENFREGIPVIINLSQMSESEARRLVDFASGLSQGLYGRIERVTNKVFLLSPAHVAVSGDQGESDSTVDAAFFPEN